MRKRSNFGHNNRKTIVDRSPAIRRLRLMAKSHLPLNALRAFEAAARHLSFTKAGLELRVTQAAVSHLVKSLEKTLGVPLFRRVPRGLALTDEGQALLPAVSAAFGQLRSAVDAFAKGRTQEIVTVGVVGTFAAG